MEHRIPEIFQSKDIVYHYCSASTAIEHILHKGELRLSNRRQAIDPIENLSPWFSYSGPQIEQGFTIRDRAKTKIGNAKQLCFCLNDETRKNNYNPQFPFEYYGFFKPRMWDQYGDKYKGVCLAFSLAALQENSPIYRNENISYITYSDLRKKHKSIDNERILNIGLEEYWQAESKRIEKNMFHKHIDYKDENEYRFLSFSEKEYDYINITNALKGIIVSKSVNDYQRQALNAYAFNNDIEMLTINWDPCGIHFERKKDFDAFVAKIESNYSSIK